MKKYHLMALLISNVTYVLLALIFGKTHAWPIVLTVIIILPVLILVTSGDTHYLADVLKVILGELRQILRPDGNKSKGA